MRLAVIPVLAALVWAPSAAQAQMGTAWDGALAVLEWTSTDSGRGYWSNGVRFRNVPARARPSSRRSPSGRSRKRGARSRTSMRLHPMTLAEQTGFTCQPG